MAIRAIWLTRRVFQVTILSWVICLMWGNGFSQSDTTSIPIDNIADTLEFLDVEETIISVEISLDAILYEMDAFNMDKIHPRLYAIYKQYNKLRAWSRGMEKSRQDQVLAKTEKMSKKTEDIHRYFDMGEMILCETSIARFKHSLGKLKEWFIDMQEKQGTPNEI